MRLRPARLLVLACAATVSIAACGDEAGDAAGRATAAAGGATAASRHGALDGSVTVLAAASLTDAFEEIGAAFESANPGVAVELNFAGSSTLREQILAGAPADVFASADTSNMDRVIDGDAAAGSDTFAENRLQIAVPAGNPAGITGLADFANGDLLIGLCAEEVPCGRLAREALADAGVTPALDTNEPDVRSLLTKIEAGELDGGIVYVTDVVAAGDAVEGVDIPAEHNVVATYPIAALTDAPNREAAEAFVAFVLSDAGQEILASHGFDTR